MSLGCEALYGLLRLYVAASHAGARIELARLSQQLPALLQLLQCCAALLWCGWCWCGQDFAVMCEVHCGYFQGCEVDLIS